jgi:acyl-CoA hydrolase
MTDARRTKAPSASVVRMSQLMRPQHGNFRGNVHGGTLLQFMDEAAYACATQYSESYCVTVAVDRVEMIAPVRVGDILTLVAAVHHTGRSSLDVGITVMAADPQRPESARLASHCYFTMVAVGEDGRPRPVPELVPETPDDFRHQCEARLRRELQARFKAELATGVCQFEAKAEGAA